MGIECDGGYAKIAMDRLARVIPATAEELAVTGSKRSEPRIPFGQIAKRASCAPATFSIAPKAAMPRGCGPMAAW